MKVFVVMGTRPEIIRLSSLLDFLEKVPSIELVVAYTNQNFTHSLSSVFFEDLELKKPKFILKNQATNPLEFIGRAVNWVSELLDAEKPDCFLVLGDTNSCLSALAAKRKQIPIFHIEAGNRCFDETVPEETNRKLVDHLADVNLTYSTISRDYLLREGKRPDLVFNVGSPLFEVYQRNKCKIAASTALVDLKLERGEYILLSFHRHEALTSKENRMEIIEAVNELADRGETIVYPIHPKSRSVIQNDDLKPNVRLIEPLNYSDYMNLQINSKCVLSDSGTINEEASMCGFFAINLRPTHERPEANEYSQTVMTGYNTKSILEAFDTNPYLHSDIAVPAYENADFSRNVTNLLLSYTNFVNRYIYAK